MTRDEAVAAIAERRVIAVVRAPSADTAVLAARALARGGVTAVEITYTTPDAGNAIRELATDRNLLVGAGTVTLPEQAQDAIDAGAAFLVSPHTDEAILDIADQRGALALPGVFTPSEVVVAARRAPLLKLFPASVGGISLLKGLLGPFPRVRFIPTGGVTALNASDWLLAGAFAIGAGSDLCSSAAITSGDFDGIEGRARDYAAALEVGRVAHG